MLTLRQVGKGEKLMSQGDAKVSCYVVLTGSFEIAPREGDMSPTAAGRLQLLPGTVCGDLQFLNGKHWRQTDVVATKDSSVAVLPPDELADLIGKENSNLSYKALISFMIEAIPRFDQLSGNLRERLGRLFVEKTFVAGTEIMREGSKLKIAYLIKEGRCNIISTENPLSAGSAQTDVQETAQLSSYLRTGGRARTAVSSRRQPKGYMSTSTTTYQLRTIGEREWFGEEVLLEEEGCAGTVGYTVVTAVKTVALAVTREGLNKFPRDVLEQLKRNAQDKISWHHMRKRDLAQSIGKINQMSTLVDYFDQTASGKQEPKNRRQVMMSATKYNGSARPGGRKLGESALELGLHRRGKTADPAASRRGETTVASVLEETEDAARGRSFVQDPITVNGENNRSCCVQEKWARGISATCYQEREQLSMFKSQSKFEADLEGETNWWNSGKRLLGTASTFKAMKNNRMLCPLFVYRPHAPRRLLAPHRQLVSFEGYSERVRENIRRKHDTFKVGVRDVRAVDPTVGKRPPSPNPVKIWAERNGIDISARNKLVRQKYAVQNEEAI